MTDNDKSLNILIRILTEQVGSEKAEDVLAAIKKESVNATDAAANLTRETEKQAESTTKLTGLHRELRSALVAIAGQSPVTGAALGSAFLGPVGAIIGAIALFREAKKALDDYNKDLDEDAAAAAESFDNSVANMQAAVDGLIKQHAQLIAALGGAGADNDPIATRIKNENELYDAQLKTVKQILEEHDKLIGKTPEQIAADMATVDEQKSKHTLDQLTREYLERDAQQTDLEKKADAAQKTHSDAEEKLKSKTDERTKLEKDIADYRKKASDAAQKVQETSPTISMPSGGAVPPTIIPNPAYAEAQKESQRAQENVNRATERHKQLNQQRQSLENAAAQTEEESQKATQAAVANKQRAGELNRQISQQQDLDRTGAAGRAEQVGVEIADKIAAGGKVAADQAQYLVDLVSRMAGHQVTLNQAVTAMEAAAQNPQVLANQIDRIIAILSQFGPTAISNLDQRLTELEREVQYAHSRIDYHGP
jgi:DNA repair exonuclease SbcCD ATPase subunit